MMLKEGHHEAYSKSNEINTHWNFWKRTKPIVPIDLRLVE